MLFKFGRETGN